MGRATERSTGGADEKRRWLIFGVVVTIVAVIGGVWNIVATGVDAPAPGPSQTLTIDPTP